MKWLAGIFSLLILFGCGSKQQDKVTSTLHYSLTGTGDTTLVFVHGWGIDGDYWSSQVEYFSPSYKVLTLDLQGHGQSPSRNTSMTVGKYADDIVQLVTELDLDNIVLIGHSMSGNINLHVYDQVPDRVVGFIGIDNLQSLGKELSEEEKKQYAEFFSEFRKNYVPVTRQFGKGLFAPETDTLVKTRVMNDVLALEPEFSVSTLEGISDEGAAEKTILPKLRVPLLLIVADGTIPDETNHKNLCGSGYKVWTYHKAGHYPMIEIPGEFNQLLAEAIRYGK